MLLSGRVPVGDWHIYIRDGAGYRIGEVSDYDSLDLQLRYNTPANWILKMPTDSPAGRAYEVNPTYGIIVTRNDITIMSGPSRHNMRTWTGKTDVLEVSGPDDLVFLQDRLAYPVPSGPPYTAQADDLQTGPAETLLYYFANVNAGPGAQPSRQIPNLIMGSDLQRGGTLIARARFISLLELLDDIGVAANPNLGFRIQQGGNGNQLVFSVYQPQDKTQTAVFSPEFGNLADFKYETQSPIANYTIGGGPGVGVARVYGELSNASSIITYGRMEKFLDARSATTAAEILQNIQTDLNTTSDQTFLSITPIDTPNLTFGKHYNVGDKVTVSVGQAALPPKLGPALESEIGQGFKNLTLVQDLIREVHITLDKTKGETIAPVIGTPRMRAPSLRQVFDGMKRLSTRVNSLERNVG